MEPSDFVKWAITAMLGGFIMLLAWNGRRLQDKVDALERDKASTKSMDELKSEMREHRTETRQALGEINSNILKIVSKL